MGGRLIDADALMETIGTHDYPLRDYFNSTDRGMFTFGIQYAVDEQPTVDAVQVVRCGECEYFDGENCCEKIGVVVWSKEWFCADGELKDGEHEIPQNR